MKPRDSIVHRFLEQTARQLSASLRLLETAETTKRALSVAIHPEFTAQEMAWFRRAK